jgi:hypothetical protein
VQNHSPAATDNLLNLMLGGGFASSGRIWTSHSGCCFYDPAKRRAGGSVSGLLPMFTP